MFQPKTINACKIVGYKCLFQGSHFRKQHNYIQYIYSYAKPPMPGGGGWSLLVFSLDSMYEDFKHLQCIWTKGNAGLPLVRYMGCKLTLYQSKYDDYIVKYDNCWPMVDTPHTHADSSPSRMIQARHKIVMPSRQTKQRRKPYKKVFIKPPPQMTNKWYFQRDMCKIPLLMLTTTAISLTEPFASPEKRNNNILLHYLNPYIFKNNNFQHFSVTTGYSPKTLTVGTETEPYYLYADLSGQEMPTQDTQKKQWLKQLIPLHNTKHYSAGATLEVCINNNKPENWGNPFYYRYTDPDTSTIYLSNWTVATFASNINGNLDKLKISKATQNLIYETVYNPDNDTGENNVAYLVKNTEESNFQPPQDKDLQIEGFPLFNLLWSWTDFIKKLEKYTNIENNYTLVILTKSFHEQDPYFVLTDYSFLHGFDPYTPETNQSHTPSYYNQQNWFPKIQFQDESIGLICESGPFVSRTKNYMQAECKYKFYFKWGGCPKQLEKAYNPCSQPKWTTPNSIDARLEIQDPNEPPETNLYYWDWSKDFVKETALQRIREHTITDDQTFSISASKSSAKATTPQTQTTKEEEEEEKLQQQLIRIRKQRVHLQLLLQLKEQNLK